MREERDRLCEWRWFPERAAGRCGMRPSTKRSGKGKPGDAAARGRRRQGCPGGSDKTGRAQPQPGPLTPSRGHTPVRPGAGGWGVSRSRSGPWRAPVSAPPPSRLAGVGSGGRTHRARVSARPTAALVQLSLGLAPLQPARLQGAGRNPLPPWHSPSGMIFLGGAGGGCSGPSVDTRKPAGRVSAEVPNMPPLW